MSCHVNLAVDIPPAMARSWSAIMCIINWRAMSPHSIRTSTGISGRRRFVPSTVRISAGEVGDSSAMLSRSSGSVASCVANWPNHLEGAVLSEVLGSGPDQAGNPFTDDAGLDHLSHQVRADLLDPLIMPAHNRPQQVVLGTEVVTYGRVVALPGGLADLAVGDRKDAVLGRREDDLSRGTGSVPLRDLLRHSHHRTGTSVRPPTTRPST